MSEQRTLTRRAGPGDDELWRQIEAKLRQLRAAPRQSRRNRTVTWGLILALLAGLILGAWAAW